MRKALLTLSIPLLLLLLWEVCLSGSELSILFPPPSKLWATFLSSYPILFHHLFVTLKEMALSLLFALLLSFPLSYAMVRFPSVGQTLQPLFVITQSIPMSAMAPLMILWFGFSMTAIILPITLMLFFPLTTTLYRGFQSTPKSLLEHFLVHGATPLQLLLKLQLPWSLPHLMSGLRISLSYAALAAIAGEWAGGQEGLGLLMLEARRSFDMPLTFAALLLLITTSLLLYGSLCLLEKRLTYFSDQQLI